MKKIDRRKALKNLTIGVGGATLLSNPLSGFATTKTNSKTIPSTKIGNPNIENPVTAITLGAGNRGNVYGNYGIKFPKELDIIGVAEPISIRKERYAKKGKRVFNKDFINQINNKLKTNLNKKAILICRSGSRTKLASNLLASNGFTNIYNVRNGLHYDWLKVNLPTTK